MIRTRMRLLAACLVVLGAAVAVAGGSAGNREGTADLHAVPGPGAVSYGQAIAYTSTFSNDSGSVFTQVKFVMPAPAGVVGDVDVTTSFERASCGSVDGGVLTCNFGQMRPDDEVSLTVVWRVQADADGTLPGCAGCLVAEGTWLIKEGKETNSNESFPVSEPADLIGASDDDVTAPSARQRAGGYQLAGCDSSTPSLSTDQALDPDENPVSTSFCVPASFVASGAADGLASTITEPASTSSDYAHRSDVCVAQPGTTCAENLPQDFSPDSLTLTFRVAADALDKNYSIEAVSHNGGAPVPEGECDADNFCVVSIDLSHGKDKVWTIVVTSESNGFYNW